MPYVPSDWVCTNPTCDQFDIVNAGTAASDAVVLCGACQQPCEYRQPVE